MSINEERSAHHINLALQVVRAVADGDQSAMPDDDAFDDMTRAEEWGLVCSMLELIAQLMQVKRGEPGFFAFDIARSDTGEVADNPPAGFLLFGQVLTAYINNERTTAMHLFYSAPPDVAAECHQQIVVTAAQWWRKRQAELS